MSMMNRVNESNDIEREGIRGRIYYDFVCVEMFCFESGASLQFSNFAILQFEFNSVRGGQSR